MLDRRTLIAAAAAALALPGALVAQEAKLPVVASFSILGDLVQAIGGARIELTTLVQPGSDAHVYKPTPADAKAVASARVVITNGLKFEGWMARLMQASASKAALVEASRGVKAVEAQGDKPGHGHGGHSHRGLDPHAWQSVANVKIYVANIRDALAAADPAGRLLFEGNAARYLAELDALEAEIRRQVARIPPDKRRVITSHDAFGYFSAAYGVEFIAPRGLSTETEASAKDVARLIQQIRRENVTAVFVETISDQRLIEQIARETGAKVGGTLFSDALSPANGPASTYILMMRHNATTIAAALAPNS